MLEENKAADPWFAPRPLADYDYLVVTGSTASGKTTRAVELAQRVGGEIVSADSRQVYRGMDLGTGKDLEEYGNVPFHLIDIVNAGERYDLHRWLQAARAAIDDIRRRGNLPVVCGGTGLYVESLVTGLRLPQVPANPQLRQALQGLSLEELTARLAAMKTLHNTTDVDTCQRAIRAIEIQQYYKEHPECDPYGHRTPDNALVIGMDISRDDRRARITRRLESRLQQGMVQEVEGLLNSGIQPEDLIYYGLEYKYLTLYVIGKISYEQMTRDLEIAIHQFAKRQMTWFRGMERRGTPILWLPYDQPINLP